MINNKNTFGKIALIVAVVYILLTAIAAFLSPVLVFRTFGDLMMQDELNAVMMLLTILMQFFELAVIIIWFIFFGRNSDAVRIPAAITLAYSICQLCRKILNYALLHTYDSFSDFMQSSWTWFPIIAAWVILVIGSKLPHRIMFSVIRGGLFLYSMVSSLAYLKNIVTRFLAAGSWQKMLAETYSAAALVITCVIWGLFIAYIIKLKLFFRSE